MEANNNTNYLKIYRYKFSPIINEELYNFGKIHNNETREEFKENWELWKKENEELIENEKERLLRIGYEGDILDKMYKSSRYYFRKKSPIKKEQKKRKKYSSINYDLLEKIDEHIKLNLIDLNKNIKPKIIFEEFLKENNEFIENLIKELKNEIIDEIKLNTKDDINNETKLILNKIKKTYKNRYYIISHK